MCRWRCRNRPQPHEVLTLPRGTGGHGTAAQRHRPLVCHSLRAPGRHEAERAFACRGGGAVRGNGRTPNRHGHRMALAHALLFILSLPALLATGYLALLAIASIGRRAV